MNIAEIKSVAAGRWPEILSAVAGIPADVLDGKKHPCPSGRCNSTLDAFGGFPDFRQTGGTVCNQCGKFADGFNTIQWFTGCDFAAALKLVSDYLGISTTNGKADRNGHASGKAKDPAASLVFEDWNESLIDIWCLKKKGVKPESLKLVGARIATHQRKQYKVIALPVWQSRPDNVVGWILYNITGGTLPVSCGGEFVQKKVKLTAGSKSGIVGYFNSDNPICYKSEGSTDLLALLSFTGGACNAFTNSNGTNQNPKTFSWLSKLIDGQDIRVIHDADKPGQDGAAKWSQWLANTFTKSAVKNLVLPYSVEPSHGKDIRDWINEGGTVEQLNQLVESTAEFVPTVATERGAATFTLDDDSGRTDLANANRFIDKYHSQLLFVPSWNRWLSWDGNRWKDDNGIGTMQRAKRYAGSLWDEVPKLAKSIEHDKLQSTISFIKSTSQSAKITAFMRLAESDERVVCPVENLNSDPLLLNTLNGTVDLRTGQLRPHDPADRITQLAPVKFDSAAACPRWLETLNLIFNGDSDVIEYVQSLLGYSLSGDVGQAILPIAYGAGNNGKSTIWNCVVEMLGDYAILANESLLLGERENHPQEKATLYQKRFVPISEPERGSKMRENRVKELTGDKTVTARRMYENDWTFVRTHTFWLSTNHLPKITGTDEAIWRRIKLIPFTVDLSKKVKPIPDYSSILAREEGSGILNWLLTGWMRYQAEQYFQEPKAVQAATTGYRDDSDSLGEFIAENCVCESGKTATASALFQRYQATGGKWSKTAFGTAMAERFEKEKPTSGEHRRKVVYLGIRLQNVADSESEDSPKTRGKTEVAPVDTSLPGGLEFPIRETNLPGVLVTTGDKPDSEVQKEVCFE